MIQSVNIPSELIPSLRLALVHRQIELVSDISSLSPNGDNCLLIAKLEKELSNVDKLLTCV